MNPFLAMSGLFAVLAGVMAVDMALVNAGVVPAFVGIRWLRVHLVTLGILTNLLFGLWGERSAEQDRRPALTPWGTAALLNGGILLLMVGIPTANMVLTYAAGAFVFGAVVAKAVELWRNHPAPVPGASGRQGMRFYITGLVFFLVGITIGTGLLFGWATAFRIRTPVEVHVHANSWGLMSLVFAGLLIDLVPRWTGRDVGRPGVVTAIYWLMTVGAAGLVIGPWTGILLVTVPGLLMHLTATVLLLSSVARSVKGTSLVREPGLWHLVTSYLWILAPVFVSPLVILSLPWFPGADVEANAPQALVYGWMLQVAVAVLPYAFGRWLQPAEAARLGGSWLGLVVLHSGGALLWAGVLIVDARGVLHAAAYGAWTIALLGLAWHLWQMLSAANTGRGSLGREAAASPGGEL